MNRYKKEIKRKHDEARKGLSKDQIATLDKEDMIKEKIEKLAYKIHCDKFPEEYDFMGDSITDANDRLRGVNPMSHEYIEKIRLKRENLGVSQLSQSGNRISNDTYELCKKEAEKKLFRAEFHNEVFP